ncbi:MAG: hypothetical protein IJX39_02370 [Clostridia bacterium]|nr:hypothetical protein [Clostridia bacterium]
MILLLSCIWLCACGEKSDSPLPPQDGSAETEPTGAQTATSTWEATPISGSANLTLSRTGDGQLSSLTVTVMHGQTVISTATWGQEKIIGSDFMVHACYGSCRVIIRAVENGVEQTTTLTVELSAADYHIALLSDSFSQLVFILSHGEDAGPTYFGFCGADRWDFSADPADRMLIPSMGSTAAGEWERLISDADAYIEELHRINASSVFHLYISDRDALAYVELMAGNGIPEDRYCVTLISSGGDSYAYFTETFGGDDPFAQYRIMQEKLGSLYAQMRGGDVTSPVICKEDFPEYAYVAAKEHTNVEWWLPRTQGTLTCSDPAFMEQVSADMAAGVIKLTDPAGLLADMSASERENFNTQCLFADNLFEKAASEGKNILLFTGGIDADPVRAVMAYCGAEYACYCLGATPGASGIVPICDLSLEAVLVFYPDITVCGYDTPWFSLNPSADTSYILLDETGEGAASLSYVASVGAFVSRVDLGQWEHAYLCGPDGAYLLIEMADDTDLYLFHVTAAKETLTRYRLEGARYAPIEE